MLWADRPSQAFRRRCVILYWIFIFGLTHWPEIDRLVFGGDWLPPDFDKFAHSCIYGGWVVMWWWLLSAGGRQIGKATASWVVVGGAVYGIFDEMTQAIVDRTPGILDWSCDVAGLIVVSLCLQAWQKRRHEFEHFTIRRSEQDP